MRFGFKNFIFFACTGKTGKKSCMQIARSPEKYQLTDARKTNLDGKYQQKQFFFKKRILFIPEILVIDFGFLMCVILDEVINEIKKLSIFYEYLFFVAPQ